MTRVSVRTRSVLQKLLWSCCLDVNFQEELLLVFQSSSIVAWCKNVLHCPECLGEILTALEFIGSNGPCSVRKSCKQVPPGSSLLEQMAQEDGFSRGGWREEALWGVAVCRWGCFVKVCFVQTNCNVRLAVICVSTPFVQLCSPELGWGCPHAFTWGWVGSVLSLPMQFLQPVFLKCHIFVLCVPFLCCCHALYFSNTVSKETECFALPQQSSLAICLFVVLC